MNDQDIIEEILLIGDYFEGIDNILSRNTQRFKDQRIIELDLSNLDPDELSPTVVELDQLKVLNL